MVKKQNSIDLTKMLDDQPNNNDENYVTRIHNYLYNGDDNYESKKIKIKSLLSAKNFLVRLVECIIRNYDPEGQIKNPMKTIHGNITTIQNNILDTLIHLFYVVSESQDFDATKYHDSRLIIDDLLYELCNELLKKQEYKLLIDLLNNINSGLLDESSTSSEGQLNDGNLKNDLDVGKYQTFGSLLFNDYYKTLHLLLDNWDEAKFNFNVPPLLFEGLSYHLLFKTKNDTISGHMFSDFEMPESNSFNNRREVLSTVLEQIFEKKDLSDGANPDVVFFERKNKYILKSLYKISKQTLLCLLTKTKISDSLSNNTSELSRKSSTYTYEANLFDIISNVNENSNVDIKKKIILYIFNLSVCISELYNDRSRAVKKTMGLKVKMYQGYHGKHNGYVSDNLIAPLLENQSGGSKKENTHKKIKTKTKTNKGLRKFGKSNKRTSHKK
jgi:hypothetical protein